MNRRIALALILALLIQPFAPGMAEALRSGSGQALAICTAEGIKWVVLDQDGSQPGPQAQHSCPCGVLCGACTLPTPERIAASVVYVAAAGFGPPDPAIIPITARVPPRHQVRAPPSSR